jgi:nitrate reductase NapAB chaperone NapD
MSKCIEELEALPGVEVHYAYPESGQIIAIQEGASVNQQQETLRQVQSLSSVLMAELVYHYNDVAGEDDSRRMEP